MSACATCTNERRGELERIGAEALRGRISWREAARRALVKNPQSLKAHMERHYEDADGDTVRNLLADVEALRAENGRLRQLVKRQRDLLADQAELVEAQRQLIRTKVGR